MKKMGWVKLYALLVFAGLCEVLLAGWLYGPLPEIIAQQVQTTINGTPPPYTFTGAGVSQTGQTFTFSGVGTTTNALTMNNSGSGAASGTTFNGSAPVTLSYNTLGAAASNAATTVSGQSCALGSTCTIPSSGISGTFLNGFADWCMYGSTSALTCLGTVTSIDGTGGTAAGTSTNPIMVQQTSAATTGSSAGFHTLVNGENIYYAPGQPTITWGIAYSASTDYSTTARVQLGPAGCSVATMSASDTPACSYTQIQYSTARGDTFYQCVNDNGSGTPVITSIGVAPTTAFTIMSINIQASSVTCTVGSTSVTNSSKVPTGSLSDMFDDTTLANVAVHIQMTGWQAVSKNRAF